MFRAVVFTDWCALDAEKDTTSGPLRSVRRSGTQEEEEEGESEGETAYLEGAQSDTGHGQHDEVRVPQGAIADGDAASSNIPHQMAAPELSAADTYAEASAESIGFKPADGTGDEPQNEANAEADGKREEAWEI